jgi:hypothetical protein
VREREREKEREYMREKLCEETVRVRERKTCEEKRKKI